MITAPHFALFYLPLLNFFVHFIPISLFLTLSCSLSFFTVPILVILCLLLPPSSVSFMISPHFTLCPLPSPLLSSLLQPRNARQTPSPISTPDVFIFLPAFHALVNSTERPTPLVSRGSSSSQFCLFLSLYLLW